MKAAEYLEKIFGIAKCTFNEHLKSYCEDLGIRGAKDKSSHVIRFTVASVLYLKGMPLTDIQRLMGHTSLSMTLHYLRKILPAKNTAEMMEKYLEEPKTVDTFNPPDPDIPSELAGKVITFPGRAKLEIHSKNA